MACETKLSEVLLRPHARIDLTRHAVSSYSRMASARRMYGLYSLKPSGIQIITSRPTHDRLNQRHRFSKLDPSTCQFIKKLTDPHRDRILSTRVDATITARETLPDTFNDLRFGSEGEVIVDMITQDDYSVARAVEAITALTSAAASPTAVSSPDDQTDDPLYNHADNVADTIHGLSRRLRYDRQSKLIDFCVQLQQQTVTDPTGAGVVKDSYRMSFWTDMPEIGMKMADYFTIGSDVGDVDGDGHQLENFTAWLARLSEMGFLAYNKGITWSHPALTCIFQKKYQATAEDVRVMCMWFIYAPKKVWTDTQKRRAHKAGWPRKTEGFEPEHWPKWKQFLQDCQVSSLEELADEYTQELTRLALKSIDKFEGQTSKSK
ncbi:unnamed protein product [Clonostachys byssicola]|uniref:Uncharacterized protein n=1 Tax=Clonostachys byssicola TaxID=160290 RepID=A0A9N9UBY4_9HYPO|nr:unnamed protein product [Clonostachys byssicola]